VINVTLNGCSGIKGADQSESDKRKKHKKERSDFVASGNLFFNFQRILRSRSSIQQQKKRQEKKSVAQATFEGKSEDKLEKAKKEKISSQFKTGRQQTNEKKFGRKREKDKFLK
jgi:hypothetical protein